MPEVHVDVYQGSHGVPKMVGSLLFHERHRYGVVGDDQLWLFTHDQDLPFDMVRDMCLDTLPPTPVLLAVARTYPEEKYMNIWYDPCITIP